MPIGDPSFIFMNHFNYSLIKNPLFLIVPVNQFSIIKLARVVNFKFNLMKAHLIFIGSL